MISFFIWLLKFIPDFLIYGAVFLSIIVYFALNFVPLLPQQKLIIKLSAMFVFVLGIYFIGMVQVVKEYEAQRIEFENKLAVAEVQSQVINEKIKYVYKDRVIKIKEKNTNAQRTIDNSATEINRNCKITPDMISIINNATK